MTRLWVRAPPRIPKWIILKGISSRRSETSIRRFAMTKTCCRCKLEKPLSDFYEKKKEDRNTSYCKKCLYQYQHERWRQRKIKAVQLMGGQCAKCKYDLCLSAMDFHHLDPNEKDAEFNTARHWTWKRLLEELKKCVLLCNRCHKEEHASEEMFWNRNAKSTPDIRLENRLKPTGKCPKCGGDVYGTEYCGWECARLARRKVQRPYREHLAKEIQEMGWTALGRKYGVTDNAVRKWAKQYGLLAQFENNDFVDGAGI